MEQPCQIGSGNDMDMIKSYGGSAENQQSSTTQGGKIIRYFNLYSILYSAIEGGLSVNTIPTDQVNKNPEIEPYVECLIFIRCVFLFHRKSSVDQ